MFNKILLMGRLTKDPELRTTQSGVTMCRFSISVDRAYSKGQEKQTDFFDITAWRQTAEFVSKWFSKGKCILIEGKLQNNNYTDQNGVKQYRNAIIADNVAFCGDKSGGQQSGQQAAPAQQPYQNQYQQGYAQNQGYQQPYQNYAPQQYQQAPQNYQQAQQNQLPKKKRQSSMLFSHPSVMLRWLLSRLLRTFSVSVLRKLRKLLKALLRLSRKALLRQKLKRSRLSSKKLALQSNSSNYNFCSYKAVPFFAERLFVVLYKISVCDLLESTIDLT